jgi:hypothetical protein
VLSNDDNNPNPKKKKSSKSEEEKSKPIQILRKQKSPIIQRIPNPGKVKNPRSKKPNPIP